jgi:hypothetical protein
MSTSKHGVIVENPGRMRRVGNNLWTIGGALETFWRKYCGEFLDNWRSFAGYVCGFSTFHPHLLITINAPHYLRTNSISIAPIVGPIRFNNVIFNLLITAIPSLPITLIFYLLPLLLPTIIIAILLN